MTPNLGFRYAGNELKPLLARPNPIRIDRWVRIGALNTNDWLLCSAAALDTEKWTYPGRESWSGLGGRSLCLSQRLVPDAPYEVAVTVRLDDESGALAGLWLDRRTKSITDFIQRRANAPDSLQWTQRCFPGPSLEQVPTAIIGGAIGIR